MMMKNLVQLFTLSVILGFNAVSADKVIKKNKAAGAKKDVKAKQPTISKHDAYIPPPSKNGLRRMQDIEEYTIVDATAPFGDTVGGFPVPAYDGSSTRTWIDTVYLIRWDQFTPFNAKVTCDLRCSDTTFSGEYYFRGEFMNGNQTQYDYALTYSEKCNIGFTVQNTVAPDAKTSTLENFFISYVWATAGIGEATIKCEKQDPSGCLTRLRNAVVGFFSP